MKLIELTKTCSKCKNRKNWKMFSEIKYGRYRFGINPQCKICIKIQRANYQKKNKDKIAIYQAEYRKINKKKLTINKKRYAENNKEKILAKRKINKKKKSIRWKEYYQKNRTKLLIKVKKYKEKNKEKIVIYEKKYKKRRLINGRKYEENNKKKRSIVGKNRRKNDPKYKLKNNMSWSMWHSLKNNKAGKSWLNLVPYTFEQLKRHLEKQFTKDMSWQNYGEWHVDHKIPLSVFNFTKPEHRDFKRAWALSNLQPMWAKENIIKSTKLIKHFQPSLLL